MYRSCKRLIWRIKTHPTKPTAPSLGVVMVAFVLWLSICDTALAKSPNCHLHDITCLKIAYAKPRQAWIAPSIDDGVTWQELAPIDTPKPQNPAKIALGKRLFFEPMLSLDGRISCASCHKPEFAFGDDKSVSAGVMGRLGRRNSPVLIHLSQPVLSLFWDGRTDRLHDQVLMPISDEQEMALPKSSIITRLGQAGYDDAFGQVFGERMNVALVADALSAYLQSLTPKPTRFDDFLQGDINALSDQELQGLHLFRTKARCMNCHFGAMMSDGKLHHLNQTLTGKAQDLGRYEITGDLADFGAFKTPTLRNLSLSKPWFHHGRFTNLLGVVALYDIGMPKNHHTDTPTDPLIQPLGLTKDERQALTAFLLTL